MEAGAGTRGIWIATVPPSEAEGLLRECYERRGETGLMFQALSLWPEALAAREALMRVAFDASIGVRRRELLFTVCAALVGCDFCTWMHGRGLLRAGFDEEQAAALKRDYRRVELEPAERAMLDYAALLTVAPWRVEEAHAESLRAAGWDDRGILEIALLGAFMNLLGRSNRGLGVDAARSRDHSYAEEAALLRAELAGAGRPVALPREAPGIWIETVAPEDADGLVRERYELWGGSPGFVIRSLSLWPEALAARGDLLRVFSRVSIGPRRRELLFTVCAALVGCGFCTSVHGQSLLRAGFGEDEIAALKRDYRRVELEAGEREMLDYAAILTVAPWRIEEAHVLALRAAGWDDRGILEVNQACAFMNMLGRSNRGLGVDAAQSRDSSHEDEAARLRAKIAAGDAP